MRKMSVSKKQSIKKVTPKRISGMELLKSKTELFQNAINTSLKRDNTKMSNVETPHRYFEKKVCSILERVFTSDAELMSHFRLSYKKGKKNEYPDFPIIMDKANNRYAIDVKTFGGKMFNNDILSLRPNDYTGEFLVVIPYDAAQKTVRKSVKTSIFAEPHLFARRERNTNHVALGGQQYSLRPRSVAKFERLQPVFRTREELNSALRETIVEKMRTDRRFKSYYTKSVLKSTKK